jgi:exodeoxyribonuclease VII small subunit
LSREQQPHEQPREQPQAGAEADADGEGARSGALSYEQAAARVEEIIRRLDSGEASLRETLELLAEGKALIEHCASELAAVGGALEELRLDELVARLEQQARQ